MKPSKTRLLSAAFAAFLLTAIQSHAIGFIDIPLANQISAGANKSGLIIDFNDGAATERYVFQYNWDGASGTISGAEMLTDVVAAVAEFSIISDGSIADGFFISQMTYDGQSQTSGDFVTNFDYWGYFIAGGTAGGNSVTGASEFIPSTVDASPTGSGESGFGSEGRFIDNNSWDVWSFGPFEASYVVPESSAYALLAGILSLGFVVCRRRRS